MSAPGRLAALALISAAFAAGCSGGSGSSTADQFPVVVTGSSGMLRVTLTAPTAPIVGTDEMELTVARISDGSPQAGLSLAVVPWMPAMDHGTSATPTVTEEGGGKYRIENLYLYMPGTWSLKTTFTGAVSDHAEPTFQLQ